MGTTAEKLTYLNTTKGKIKDSINLTGANIGSNDTFRSYAVKLRDGLVNVLNNGTIVLYNNFPKVSGTGSNISLSNTLEAPMFMNKFDGDTLQNGTPTPSTPIEIQSVEGIQNISVYGKNLFDKDTITSGKEISNGQIYNNSSWCVSDYIIIEYNQKYIKNINNGNDCIIYDKDKNQISNNNRRFSNNMITITEQNAKYIRINLPLTSLDTYQLEQGSTPTTYEEHKEQTYEVNLEGKNLWNNTQVVDTSDYIENNGTGFKLSKTTNGRITPEYTISIPANTSIIITNILKNYTTSNGIIYCQWVATDNTIIWTPNINNTSITTSFNKDIKGVKFYLQTNETNGNYVEIENLMIRYASISDSEYVPYRLPIKLYNGDYITGTTDNWSVKHVMGEVVLDGTQTIAIANWRASETSVGWVYAYNVFNNAYVPASNVGNIISNKLITSKFDDLFQKNKDNGIAVYTNTDYSVAVRTSDTTLTTASLINNYLSNNPIKVVYELATPTTEQITDTYLISQLNDLYNAKSCNGQTNILVSGNLPMILEVSALKDEI